MGVDHMKSTSPIFFENKVDAEKAASLRLGDWDSAGRVNENYYIQGKDTPPKAFATVTEWAETKLTIKQAREYGLM